ncbi:TPA: hypothetical protein HA235_07955 [Candidatus Woesearchaeota archaeon]|nr:hypothetical protein [Candidatus Woesearchaeota archaeon]HIJ13709.1 hypothetical protein [Candidatus Woesearchaeota archaeon]
MLIIIFSLIGLFFSGYLTVGQLLTGTCPIGGGCPFLWGYPVCTYGFIMFIILFFSSLMLHFKKGDTFTKKILLIVSIIGVLFSLYFAIQELFVIKCPGGCKWPLLLPTCIYGLIMYLIILYAALKLNR